MASNSKDGVVKKTKRISFGEVNILEFEPLEPHPEAKVEKPEEDEKEVEERRAWLMDLMKHSLGLVDTPEKKLDTLDIDGVANFIKSGKCKKIVTMAGAGISTSAGIPDFRSPNTGLYANLQKYNLPHPQAVFDIGYFWKNPEPFFHLAKELWPGVFKPTLCHYFIKMLDDKGLLLRHYTQNIDTLETHAGLNPEKLVEAHGSFRTAHCLICEKEYSKDFIEEKVFAGEIPKCQEPDCEDNIVKPDIVFFGEPLPKRFAELSSQDMGNCDLLLVMGTSLVVQPFASLTSRVKHETPRMYINLEKTGSGSSNPITILMFGGGFKFDDENNYRDVFWQGTCDDGCLLLAEKLGWKEELLQIVKEEHAKIDESVKLLKAKSDSIQREKQTANSDGDTGGQPKSAVTNKSNTEKSTLEPKKDTSSKAYLQQLSGKQKSSSEKVTQPSKSTTSSSKSTTSSSKSTTSTSKSTTSSPKSTTSSPKSTSSSKV